MNAIIKCIFIAVVLTCCYSPAIAQNKVVVVPLGADNTFAGEATISIPVNSLVNSSGGNPAFISTLGVVLEDTGNSSFGTSIIIPQDHKPGTRIYVDIYVYNPVSNGACQAIIRTNYGRSWKPGEPRDSSGVFGFAPVFPAFTQGEQTYQHTFRFGDDKGAGDAIVFGMFRQGNAAADNCGDVGLVGLNIRYERQ
ncbi:MAG: hypothetical protein AAF431_01455 [Pseudomonadota bacterium]